MVAQSMTRLLMPWSHLLRIPLRHWQSLRMPQQFMELSTVPSALLADNGFSFLAQMTLSILSVFSWRLCGFCLVTADVVYRNAWFAAKGGFVYGGSFWLNRLAALTICHQTNSYRASRIAQCTLTHNEEYPLLDV
ncbi:MAG: hypothetical protein VKO39_09745 [Cyanobacteriota bacterium]|nr:hypothetical protein [Cyanobacteriota bacterium]